MEIPCKPAWLAKCFAPPMQSLLVICSQERPRLMSRYMRARLKRYAEHDAAI